MAEASNRNIWDLLGNVTTPCPASTDENQGSGQKTSSPAPEAIPIM